MIIYLFLEVLFLAQITYFHIIWDCKIGEIIRENQKKIKIDLFFEENNEVN